MNKKFSVGLLISAFVFAAQSQERETQLDEMHLLADQMLKEAVEHYLSVPFDQVQRDFMDLSGQTPWLRQPYHQHIAGFRISDGMTWADNIYTDLVGLDFTTLTDYNGIPFGQLIADNTRQGDSYGIDIVFTNPAHKRMVACYGACIRPDDKNILCVWTESDDIVH